MLFHPRPVPVLAPVLTTVLIGGALLTGCGAGGTPQAAGGTPQAAGGTTSSAATAPTESTPAPASDGGADGSAGGGRGTEGDGSAEAPPFPADTEPDTAAPSTGSLVTVTDVRVGAHEGFDRVVFEVGGTGAPGWDVRYVDQAASQGSGDPVDVAGEAVLQVTLTGVGYPYDTGEEEHPIGAPVAAAGTTAVTEVVFDGTFEGQSVAFVGTSARTPFRVHLLEDPTRVVVEVADQR